MQLGGHADGDYDVHRVAAKEAHEESGISTLELVSEDIFDIDIHQILLEEMSPNIFTTTPDSYLEQPTMRNEVSNESIDLAWVNIDEIDEYSSEESILRMVKKLKTISRASQQVFAHSLISHRKSSSSELSRL